jgi:hypothetical protein
MLRFLVLALAVVMFVMVAVTLIVTAVVMLAFACIIGIPLWIMAKPRLERMGVIAPRLNPMERLRNLYVEGKIDLFEFERRVAKLLALEH